MKNKKIILLVIVVAVALLGLRVYSQFQKFGESISKIQKPSFNIPKPNFNLDTSTVSEKKFTSEDKRVSFIYPSDFKETNQNILTGLNETATTSIEVLFYAYKMGFPDLSFSFFTLEKINATGSNATSVIEKIKQSSETKQEKIKILNREDNNNETTFEALYQKDSYDFHSKERIYFFESEVYLLSFFAQSNTWDKSKNIFDKILESVKIY